MTPNAPSWRAGEAAAVVLLFFGEESLAIPLCPNGAHVFASACLIMDVNGLHSNTSCSRLCRLSCFTVLNQTR